MKTVYLAGPVSHKSFEAANAWRESMASALALYGIAALNPLRDQQILQGVESLHPTCKGEPVVARHVFSKAFQDATHCDLVFVNFLESTRASIGTVMEIVWASERGIPVVAVIDHVHDHAMLHEVVGWCLAPDSHAAYAKEIATILGVEKQSTPLKNASFDALLNELSARATADLRKLKGREYSSSEGYSILHDAYAAAAAGKAITVVDGTQSDLDLKSATPYALLNALTDYAVPTVTRDAPEWKKARASLEVIGKAASSGKTITVVDDVPLLDGKPVLTPTSSEISDLDLATAMKRISDLDLDLISVLGKRATVDTPAKFEPTFDALVNTFYGYRDFADTPDFHSATDLDLLDALANRAAKNGAHKSSEIRQALQATYLEASNGDVKHTPAQLAKFYSGATLSLALGECWAQATGKNAASIASALGEIFERYRGGGGSDPVVDYQIGASKVIEKYGQPAASPASDLPRMTDASFTSPSHVYDVTWLDKGYSLVFVDGVVSNWVLYKHNEHDVTVFRSAAVLFRRVGSVMDALKNIAVVSEMPNYDPEGSRLVDLTPLRKLKAEGAAFYGYKKSASDPDLTADRAQPSVNIS